MTIEKALKMINNYLSKADDVNNYIDEEWIKVLTLCRETLQNAEKNNTKETLKDGE